VALTVRTVSRDLRTASKTGPLRVVGQVLHNIAKRSKPNPNSLLPSQKQQEARCAPCFRSRRAGTPSSVVVPVSLGSWIVAPEVSTARCIAVALIRLPRSRFSRWYRFNRFRCRLARCGSDIVWLRGCRVAIRCSRRRFRGRGFSFCRGRLLTEFLNCSGPLTRCPVLFDEALALKREDDFP
jgi:hypothetical protein